MDILIIALINKTNALFKLEKLEEALLIADQILLRDPSNHFALNFKERLQIIWLKDIQTNINSMTYLIDEIANKDFV